jgi:hypothetical protein
VPNRRTTTKDVGLLHQLHRDGQLELAPEFQRNSVWPHAAKAYLIDTILADRPIPLLFLQRHTSAQTGRPAYTVIDGQQRLRAVFDFLEDRFRLTQSDSARLSNKRFSGLGHADQDLILNYDFVVEELSGYSDGDIRDLFVRINKYVVSLSPQELRHAREAGAFYDFVESLGRWDFWKDQKVFTPLQLRRMRAVEFSAELAVLLAEGPQDKKAAIDLYYGAYKDAFPYHRDIERRLTSYLEWLVAARPDLSASRFRKPVDLYALLAVLDRHTGGRPRVRLDPDIAGERLRAFERTLRRKRPPSESNRYLIAASRQTDNIRPRLTRMQILEQILISD